MADAPSSGGVRNYLAHVWTVDRRRCSLALVLSVVSAVTESFGLLLLVPLLTTAGLVGDGSSSLPWLIDALDAVGVPITFGWILVVYVVLVAVRAGVGWWRQIVVAELRHRVVDELRFELFEALARARWSFHLRNRSSDLSHTLTADVARVSSGTTALLDVIARLVATVGYLVVAFRLSAPVTGLAIVVLAALVGLLWPVVRRARSLGSMQTLRGRDNFAVQQQFFDALKVVKSHGAEDAHVARYRTGVEELRDSILTNERLTARSAALLQAGVAACIALLAWLAVDVFETEGARLLVLVAVIARLAPMASTLLNRSQLVANMLPAYSSARRWLTDADAERESAVDAAADSGARLTRKVELRGVTFGYRPGEPILERFDLTIPCGTTVGLVGRSGVGKTTVADLMLGLIEPDDGQVSIDGTPLVEFGVGAWRSQVAYVPQETYLFNDTLRSNITWGRDADDDGRIMDVIRAASLADVVAGLSDGLDTVVGDRGVRLSGGERQRVAIARALWRQPSLLVLDEATSALDQANERIVQDAIDDLQGSVTMLVIAHRRSTLERADQVVDLGG